MNTSKFKRLSVWAFALLPLAACTSDSTDSTLDDQCNPAPIETIGARILELHDCTSPDDEACGKTSLYREADKVQLVVTDAEGAMTGHALGLLQPAAAAQIDAKIAEIVAGEADLGGFYAECLYAIYEPPVVLTLPTTFDVVEFRHPNGCGLPGLSDIESDLHYAVEALQNCTSTDSVEVQSCAFDSKPNHP